MRNVSVEERARELAQREGLTLPEARFEVEVGAKLNRGDNVVIDRHDRRVRVEEPTAEEALDDA